MKMNHYTIKFTPTEFLTLSNLLVNVNYQKISDDNGVEIIFNNHNDVKKFFDNCNDIKLKIKEYQNAYEQMVFKKK